MKVCFDINLHQIDRHNTGLVIVYCDKRDCRDFIERKEFVYGLCGSDNIRLKNGECEIFKPKSSSGGGGEYRTILRTPYKTSKMWKA